jgi:tetratricopeptide (TPR) repeat protein
VGNAKTCAEIHISSVINTADEDEAMKASLAAFRPDLDYQSDAENYFRLASILFKNEPGLAAPYYKSALDALPDNPKYLTRRRTIIDQLIMSLGMSGDLKNSRAVAAIAIAKDPDYPLNYYNLACADAEQGKAEDAKLHLQQAFDRRANVISGEKMPDPMKDDSILKLRNDKAFWAFVMTLPKD